MSTCTARLHRRWEDPDQSIEIYKAIYKAMRARTLAFEFSSALSLPCFARTLPSRFLGPGCRHRWSRLNRAVLQATSTTFKAAEPAAEDMAALPTLYQRLVAKHVGENFREVAIEQECQLQHPDDGEVLVKISFAGVNGGCETFRARGEYAFASNRGKENFPLGAEAAGVVVAVGPGVDNLQVGQAVTVMGAGYAEFAVSKAAMCFPVRKASGEAVAVALSGLTAACALLYTGEIKEGDTVLVTAAAGGTGHFGVQIAKLRGCKVIATCGSAEKAARLKQIGADRVINYYVEDVATVLDEEFPKQIDVAYEGVGGRLRDAVLANLSPTGRLLAVGYISDYPHTRAAAGCGSSIGAHNTRTAEEEASTSKHTWDLPPADKLMWEGLTLKNGQQTVYGQVWPKDRQHIMEAKNWIFEQYYQGNIQAWIDSRPFKGLHSVIEATEYMLSGNSIGKVVINLT